MKNYCFFVHLEDHLIFLPFYAIVPQRFLPLWDDIKRMCCSFY